MLDLHFDVFPRLETARLLLREPSLMDAPALFALRSDEEVMKYIDRPLCASEQEAAGFLQRMKDHFDANDAISWVIQLKDNPGFIGYIGFWRVDKPNYRAEIGYMLAKEHQGKGMMQEALETIVQYGFKTMQLHSMEANINPGNLASQALLEKCGFYREAYFRENYYFDGKFLDSAIYSLLNPYSEKP